MIRLARAFAVVTVLILTSDAHATIVINFSFDDDTADDIFGLTHIPGSVMGMLTLEENQNGQTPSSIVISSAPATLDLDLIGVDLTPFGVQTSGTFDVASGVVTSANFFFDFDDSDGDIMALRFNHTASMINALTNEGVNGSSATDVGVTGNRNGFAGTSFSSVPEPSSFVLVALVGVLVSGLKKYCRPPN